MNVDSSIRVDGLLKARRLIHSVTTQIVDQELSHDDVVQISSQIDYLLVALRALGEANTTSDLDREIRLLLEEN